MASSETHKIWYEKNRERVLAQRKERWANDPELRAQHLARTRELYNERYRARRHAKKYGITVEESEVLLAQTKCEICGGESPLHTDHDHKTGIVRGMLCNNCNNGLGRFKDNPAFLRNAATFLEAAND